ncbi:MAG: hypothetical protein SOU32_08905 [Lachnospiraceae bacterium]|nr:hypothetical protein [Lachnospiraceae bacterium]
MPNAAAGASAPMLQFESGVSTPLSNEYLAEAKSADAVLPNAAAGASAPMLQFESPASAGLSNLYPADAVSPNAAAHFVLYYFSMLYCQWTFFIKLWNFLHGLSETMQIY